MTLVLGGSGYFGWHLVNFLRVKQEDFAWTYGNAPSDDPASFGLDITNREEVAGVLDEYVPRAVVNLAAINPGFGDAEDMMQVNSRGAHVVAEACALRDIPHVFMSTDMVHDGVDAPFADDAAPTPINDYGRSKAEGESWVTAVHPEATIIRTSLIYSLQRVDRGTMSFMNRIRAGEPLNLFSDVIRQPVHTDTLCEAIMTCIEREVAGTINIVGNEAMSREEFGLKMLAFWKAPKHNIGSIEAAEISDSIPLDLRLQSERADELEIARPGVSDILGN